MRPRLMIVIGSGPRLPALLAPTDGNGEVLVLALGPRVTDEQQRVVEEAITVAVERRIPFEARVATPAEAAGILREVGDDDVIRRHCSRRELRVLRRLSRRGLSARAR